MSADVLAFGFLDAHVKPFDEKLPATFSRSDYACQVATPKKVNSNSLVKLIAKFLGISDANTSLFPTSPFTLPDLSLDSLRFVHRTHFVNQTQPDGLWLETDTTIDKSCGELYSFLKDVLGMKTDSAKFILRAKLEEGRVGFCWDHPLCTSNGLVLEALIAETEIGLFEHLDLTSAGVRIYIYEQQAFTQKSAAYKVGFGVFGSLAISVGKKILTLDCDLSIISRVAALDATLSGDIWEDALGIEGLKLSRVALTSNLPLNKPAQLAFDLSASLVLGDTEIILFGSYSPEEISIQAKVDDLDWALIDAIYFAVSKEHLQKPSVEFHLSSGWITISSVKGLTIVIEELKVDTFTLQYACLNVNKAGLYIYGAVKNIEIADGMLLEEAALSFQVSFKSFDFSFGIFGDLKIGAVDFAASGALVRSKTTAFALMAELDLSRPRYLSDLVPELKDTCVDVGISEVRLAAASLNAPVLQSKNQQTIVVQSGIAVSAKLELAKALAAVVDQFPKDKKVELLLRAGCALETRSFNLDIEAANLPSITIGDVLRTKSYMLSVRSAPVCVRAAATVGLTVETSGTKTELELSGALAFTSSSIQVGLSLVGVWKNPFGVGEHVSVANLAVDVGVTLPPTSFIIAFNGEFQIDKLKGSLAFQISQDPSACYIDATAKNVGLEDICCLVPDAPSGMVSQAKDMLTINEFALYICPKPMVNVATGKPLLPGISFHCDCDCFGKKAYIDGHAAVYPNPALKFAGWVENFEIGGLKIGSATGGDRARLEFELSKEKQFFLVDGAVDFENIAHASADVEFSNARFHLKIEFTVNNWISYSLEGDATQSGIPSDLGNVDFYVKGSFEQNIRKQVVNEIVNLFHADDTMRKVLEGVADNIGPLVEISKISLEGRLSSFLDNSGIKLDIKLRVLLKAEFTLSIDSFDLISVRDDHFVGDLAKQIKPAVLDQLPAPIRAITGAIETVGKGIGDAASAVGSAVETGAREIGSTVETGARNLGNALETVGHDIGDAFEDVGDSIGNVFKKIF